MSIKYVFVCIISVQSQFIDDILLSSLDATPTTFPCFFYGASLRDLRAIFEREEIKELRLCRLTVLKVGGSSSLSRSR